MTAKRDLTFLLETLPYWQRAGLYMAGVLPFMDHFPDTGKMDEAAARAILDRIKSAAPARQRDLFGLD